MFLGGSDLGIAKNSPNQAQALAWVKLYTGTINQLNQAREEGFIPNASNLVGQGQPLAQFQDLLQGRGREPIHATGPRLGDGRGGQRHAGPVRPGGRRPCRASPPSPSSTTRSSTACSTLEITRHGRTDSAQTGRRVGRSAATSPAPSYSRRATRPELAPLPAAPALAPPFDPARSRPPRPPAGLPDRQALRHLVPKPRALPACSATRWSGTASPITAPCSPAAALGTSVVQTVALRRSPAWALTMADRHRRGATARPHRDGPAPGGVGVHALRLGHADLGRRHRLDLAVLD